MSAPDLSGGSRPSLPAAAGDTTRRDAINAFATTLAAGQIAAQALTPREHAERAWHPGSRHTVDQLEDMVRADRGLPPIHTRASA